jgi:hypothetical protein
LRASVVPSVAQYIYKLVSIIVLISLINRDRTKSE